MKVIKSNNYRDYLPLKLGQVVATPGALEAMEQADSTPMPYLVRHAMGDWGDIDQDDWQLNNDSLVDGERILSCYKLRDNQTTIWIITERDRSVTTILLPSEY
jgi:hypothetical protein